MKDNEILEYIRWIDIPDCKKYKEFLESKDKEVVRLAIELLIIDRVERCQIDRCKERFLHEYHWDPKWSKNIVYYEPINSLISVVV